MNNIDGEQPLNLVVLIGTVSAAARTKSLPSGDWLVAFDLRVPAANGPRQSIPVSWIGEKAKAPTIVADGDLMVVGEVRRRFYRAGGALGSQVDVRAHKVVKGARARANALSALL